MPGRLWFFRRCSRRVGGQAAGGKETEGGQGVSCEGIWERTAQRADVSGRGMQGTCVSWEESWPRQCSLDFPHVIFLPTLFSLNRAATQELVFTTWSSTSFLWDIVSSVIVLKKKKTVTCACFLRTRKLLL